jgi:hypothetical protein
MAEIYDRARYSEYEITEADAAHMKEISDKLVNS